MCSLTPPSSAGINIRLLGGVEGEHSLPNRHFSSRDANSDIDSKIIQLELKRARLEAQITLSKTQTMLAEMELHLVEIELRHELWRHRSEVQARPPAKSPTRRRYRRLLVRKQVKPSVRPRYRTPRSCTQNKRHETARDMVNVEGNEQLTDRSGPVDDQSHHNQVGEFEQTEHGEVTNDQRSLKEGASEINPKRTEKQHDSRSNPDHCHLDAAPGESPPALVPENVENRIEPQDAALIANPRDDTDAKHADEKTTEMNDIIGEEDEKHQSVSRKEQKSTDYKAKTIKKVKRRTYEDNAASSNICLNKYEEAETNTEALNPRNEKSEKKSVGEKMAAAKSNSVMQNNSMKTCSITMVRIPFRLRTLNPPEINNNDVNSQNSETDREDAVDTTISQIKDIESTPREKRSSSGTKEANSTSAVEGTNTGAVRNIARKIRSNCVKVVHKEQNTIKKYSNEKKRSETMNIDGKENVINASKERHRSRDSKTKSSYKDNKYESKRYTTSTSNVYRDKEKYENNDRHESNADKSQDISRRSKNTGHRHKKDEVDTNKDNAKNKENQPKPFTLFKICYDQTKVDEYNRFKSKSSVERTSTKQSSGRSEGAKNIDSVGDRETETNDNYFLRRENYTFDRKSNILDRTTQELQDLGNNLLFAELRNCSVKKERSLSLSSLETLKLYEN